MYTVHILTQKHILLMIAYCENIDERLFYSTQTPVICFNVYLFYFMIQH